LCVEVNRKESVKGKAGLQNAPLKSGENVASVSYLRGYQTDNRELDWFFSGSFGMGIQGKSASGKEV
jgi:hypothetical protein